MKILMAIAICIAALLGCASVLKTLAPRVASEAQDNASPAVIAKQLMTEGGIIPAEIQRAKVHLSSPNEINYYSCVVKNNSKKAITALSLKWTFTIDSNSRESSFSEYSEMDAVIHPDIRSHRRLRAIAPDGESTLDSSGSLGFNPPVRIVKAEVSVNYVEFDDKSTIDVSPNHNGSKNINLVRQGAETYKQWVRQIYKQSGNSLNAVLQQLQSNAPQAGLQLNGGSMQQGAKLYKGFLLDLYTKDQAKLETYLNQ